MSASVNQAATPPGKDPETMRVNHDLAERVRDVIDALGEQMITATFALVQAKMASDATTLELYEMAGSPEGASVLTFVAPDLLEAPMESDEPTSTLVIRLERPQDSPIDVGLSGDRLRLFLPVSKQHVYPEPLEDDALPPEIYLEVSDSQDTARHQRYIIQRDENDLSPDLNARQRRYAVFEYESAADTGEEVVHGSLSDRMIYRGLQDRVPVNAEFAMQLIRGITNYDVVYQGGLADAHDPPAEQEHTA